MPLGVRTLRHENTSAPGLRRLYVTRVVLKKGPFRLLRSFHRLGNMAGKPISEVAAAAGPWSSRSSLAGGMWLYQWQAVSSGGGYHIGLLVGADGKVIKVSHESRV